MRPLDILVREHTLVLLGLDVLERAALAGARARDTDLARLLDFFRAFLDEHHHAKEEGDLFPAMLAAGLPARGGPVTVMLDEHDQGRMLIAAMARDLGDRPRFAESARMFASLLRGHIEKENHVLYPMAERLVAPATLAAFGERWSKGAGVESTWRDELAELDRALPAA